MGWNGSGISARREHSAAPKNAQERTTRGRGVWRGILACLVVACVAGAAMWLIFWRGEPGQTPDREKKRRAQIQGVVAKPRASVPAKKAEEEAPPAAVAEPAPTANVTRVRHTVQMRTLPDGTKEPVGRPYFTNHVERALSTLCNPGGMAIPLSSALRRFSDAEIMRILNAPMIYDKNDSDFILARKMEMQRIKDEILAYVADGHALREALAEADRIIRRDSTYLMMTRKSMRDALATGDGELIRAYTKTLNEKLVERGMKPFEVPPQFRADVDSQGGPNDKE